MLHIPVLEVAINGNRVRFPWVSASEPVRTARLPDNNWLEWSRFRGFPRKAPEDFRPSFRWPQVGDVCGRRPATTWRHRVVTVGPSCASSTAFLCWGSCRKSEAATRSSCGCAAECWIAASGRLPDTRASCRRRASRPESARWTAPPWTGSDDRRPAFFSRSSGDGGGSGTATGSWRRWSSSCACESGRRAPSHGPRRSWSVGRRGAACPNRSTVAAGWARRQGCSLWTTRILRCRSTASKQSRFVRERKAQDGIPEPKGKGSDPVSDASSTWLTKAALACADHNVPAVLLQNDETGLQSELTSLVIWDMLNTCRPWSKAKVGLWLLWLLLALTGLGRPLMSSGCRSTFWATDGSSGWVTLICAKTANSYYDVNKTKPQVLRHKWKTQAWRHFRVLLHW